MLTPQLPNIYYTLHSHVNNAFTLKNKQKDSTSIVAFKSKDDAHKIGKMIETYFIREKQWPVMTDVESLILPVAPASMVDLLHIHIHEWEFEDLQLSCTSNFLDLISINSISDKQNGITFTGDVYSFDAPVEFYKDRLDEIYQRGI